MVFILVMLGGTRYLSCCCLSKMSLKFVELKAVCAGEVSFLGLADSYPNLPNAVEGVGCTMVRI